MPRRQCSQNAGSPGVISDRGASGVRAYIALGANLGDPLATLRQAMDAIGALPQTRLIKRSSWYRTAPLGYESQPDFLNAVVAVDTDLDPERLLGALLAIERRLGRERSFANAPRTIDLDILLFGTQTHASATLTIPHPRMHERAFVLAPLVEVGPDVEIPGIGLARHALERCPPQRIERLA